MRISRRFVLGSVLLTAVAGGSAWTVMRSSASAEPVKTLTSAEFNALHDQKLVLQLLKRTKVQRNQPASSAATNDRVTVTFFRLLGCPFCARIKTILDLLHIPYTEVVIDPLSGSGIQDPRYPLVPQLRFDAKDAPAAPLIVDSAAIIVAIASVYGFQKDLLDPKIQATREWLADRFQGVTFGAINATWWSAFYSYPELVPAKYDNILCRVVGATALNGLASWKILPRLKERGSPESQALIANKKLDEWLLEESKTFTSKVVDIKTNTVGFHGGAQPDLADVEMYAVMRTVAKHPLLSNTINAPQTDLSQWLKRMDEYVGDGKKCWK